MGALHHPLSSVAPGFSRNTSSTAPILSCTEAALLQPEHPSTRLFARVKRNGFSQSKMRDEVVRFRSSLEAMARQLLLLLWGTQ